MKLSVGIDIGGTFTDVVLVSDDGRAWTAKVASTPDDPAKALLQGLLAALGSAGARYEDLAAVIHGTTVGTNAVLERKGARLGILTTSGFEDTLFIGRQKRSEMYDLFIDPETPGFLCERGRIVGIPERLDARGLELEALDVQAVRDGIERLVEKDGVDAVAVCFLFSFLNPEHEDETLRILRDRFPDLHVSLSSRVDARFREYERLVVTAFDAYIGPVMRRYLRGLRDSLDGAGIRASLQVMQSYGGIVDSRLSEERPVGTLLSGLAAGVWGARETGVHSGYPDIVSLDVGGTSADVALVLGGRPLVTDDGKIGSYPLRQPMVDVTTIGAGGGSIAYVDATGSLHVGPESAGANPGPVAYGRGGEKPTVTDASVVLGFLGGEGLAGGSVSLDADAARAAVAAHVAQRLGIDVAAAAWGMHRIVNAAMADAIRLVSVRRGHDPRKLSLVACGGAGPVHACSVAEQLGIARILVPSYPGLLSAYGLLASDIKVQDWRTYRGKLADIDLGALSAAVADLVASCNGRLQRSGLEGVGARVRTEADLRYVGQSYELTVPFAYGAEVSAADISRLTAEFGELHEKLYGQHDPDGAVELVGLRAEVSVPRTAAPIARPRRTPAGRSERAVYVPGSQRYERVPCIARDEVAGDVRGPAVITQDDSTTVVLPGWSARQEESGTLILERSVAVS